MRFFPALRRSLTSTQFYWQVLNLPIRSSIFFWLKFYLWLLAGIVAVAIIAAFAIGSVIEQYFPNDLVLSYTEGNLESNQTLPISGRAFGYTLSIGTDGVGLTTERGDRYSSTYTELLGELPAFTLDKATTLANAPVLIPIFTVFFALICISFLAMLRGPLLLLYVLVIHSALSIVGKRIPYTALLQMGLHAAVVAEMFNILYFILYRSREFPMYDVVFFGIMILVLRTRRAQIVRTG